MIYSHSRLGTFENCPLKFKFKYIDRLESTIEGIETFMGSRVHETLEKLYRDKRFQKNNSLEELLAFYTQQWEKNWHENIKIVRKEYTADNYKKMGEKYISEYFEQYKPFDQEKTLGLEERVTIDLGSGYKLQGIIDRLALAGSVYEIHDYKTNMNPRSQEELDKDRQLALYSIAVKEKFPDAKKIELVWHYLSIAKEMRSTRTEKQLEELKKEIRLLIDKIERSKEEDFFPAKESALCAWCEFAEFCPRQKHLLETAKLSPTQFRKNDGVKLVNKYVHLESLKREFLEKIEPEIEKARLDLLEYSKQHSIENIAGSDFIARIRCYPHLSFPPEERSEIKRILIESKKINEVLDINYYELAKKLNSKEWDSKLVKKILSHALKNKNVRIYLGKKKNE